MSVCVQADDESSAEEPGAPVREMYEAKAVSKVVRVLTVLAYLLSVSLAAILLSVYYVWVWKSPELPMLNETGELSARRGGHDDYNINGMQNYNSSGGSNTTVNSTEMLPTSSNITSLADESEPSPPSSTDLAELTSVLPELTTNISDATTEFSGT